MFSSLAPGQEVTRLIKTDLYLHNITMWSDPVKCIARCCDDGKFMLASSSHIYPPLYELPELPAMMLWQYSAAPIDGSKWSVKFYDGWGLMWCSCLSRYLPDWTRLDDQLLLENNSIWSSPYTDHGIIFNRKITSLRSIHFTHQRDAGHHLRAVPAQERYKKSLLFYLFWIWQLNCFNIWYILG